MAFNGKNPHSIVILDNCGIHHIQETVQIVCNLGALIHFLPPYSPDYNPIQYMFSKLKQILKVPSCISFCMNFACFRLFMQTSAARSGDNSRHKVLLPGVVGVEGEELVVLGQKH